MLQTNSNQFVCTGMKNRYLEKVPMASRHQAPNNQNTILGVALL